MPTKTPGAIYIETGKPMVIDDIDLPDPGPTQVLVKQFATGVCHSQLHELDRPNPTLPAGPRPRVDRRRRRRRART